VQQFVAARCLAASSIVVKQISLPSGSTLFATQIFILLVCSHGAVAASCSPARLRKPSQIQKIKQKKQKKNYCKKETKVQSSRSCVPWKLQLDFEPEPGQPEKLNNAQNLVLLQSELTSFG